MITLRNFDDSNIISSAKINGRSIDGRKYVGVEKLEMKSIAC